MSNVKQKDSIAGWMDLDATESAVECAVDQFQLPVHIDSHVFVLYVHKESLFSGHCVASKMNRLCDNVTFKVEAHDGDDVGEWLLRHIGSGKSYYSPGA